MQTISSTSRQAGPTANGNATAQPVHILRKAHPTVSHSRPYQYPAIDTKQEPHSPALHTNSNRATAQPPTAFTPTLERRRKCS